MMDDDARISDADRERAVALLRQATVDGRLTTDELLARTEAALTARTRGELVAVTRDLVRVAPSPSQVPATTRVQAVLGETQRAGHWVAEGHVDVVAILGETKVDLRDAEIRGSELVLQVTVIMGSVKIYVPEGVPVVIESSVILGSQKDKRLDVEPIPGAPTIRIRGFELMSSLEVLDEEPALLDRLSDALYGRDQRRLRRREERAARRRDR